ncbi:hypothetical protein D9611_003972 [Ephemerocybe angulata]|uniref:Alpha/beta hydrolase fold-3 domain-containing protein n=1 Tax=Ephemerocybe angulata TaxID=980116 RepID=A0A8H5B711_9AGAR|nr:hypothetical protein D9611_003972 [Tulosesus angulatus]
MHQFRQQPLKGLYLVYQLISTIFVRLPLWAFLNAIRSLRPRPSWNIQRVLAVNSIRHVMNVTNETGPLVTIPDYRAIKPGEGVEGVWVSPAPELVTGELEKLAEIANVTPIRIPGYWLHKKGTNIEVAAGLQPEEKVLYNLHGGAYCRMSAHPSDITANIVKGILEHVPSIKRAFSVEYRLSSTKPFPVAHPFPTALLDALSGYNYLVNELGIPPSSIVMCGDSAGGNLAQALTRYLVENQGSNPDTKVPTPPGALILLSPWSDLSQYHEDMPGGSAFEFANSDYVGERNGGTGWAKDAFTGPHGRSIADTSPYVSPASLHPGFTISFKGFPRTFINGGGAEVLIDQIRTLRDRMVHDLGEGNGVQDGDGRVRYHEAPDGVHDYLVFPWHEPERSDTLRAIADWVEA